MSFPPRKQSQQQVRQKPVTLQPVRLHSNRAVSLLSSSSVTSEGAGGPLSSASGSSFSPHRSAQGAAGSAATASTAGVATFSAWRSPATSEASAKTSPSRSTAGDAAELPSTEKDRAQPSKRAPLNGTEAPEEGPARTSDPPALRGSLLGQQQHQRVSTTAVPRSPGGRSAVHDEAKGGASRALVELFPTGVGASSVNVSMYSSSDGNRTLAGAAATTTANNTLLTGVELPTVSRSSISGSTSDFSHRSCRSVAETAPPSSRDMSSSTTSADRSALSLLALYNKNGTAASLTSSSINAIPHPPVILTARALARASRTSVLTTGQAKSLSGDDAAAAGGSSSNAFTPTEAATKATLPTHSKAAGGSATAARTRVLPQHRIESLSATARPTTSLRTPIKAVAAPAPAPAATAAAAAVVVSASAQETPRSPLLPASAIDTLSWPPAPPPNTTLMTAAATPTTQASGAASLGVGAAQGRRRLRHASNRQHSLTSLSSSSVPSLGPPHLNEVRGGSANKRKSSGSTSNVARSMRGSPSRRSSSMQSDVGAAPPSAFAVFATTDVFDTMLPSALTSRGRSRESLSTVCSGSTTGPGSPSVEKPDAMPQVLDTNTAAMVDAPPSCSATAEGIPGEVLPTPKRLAFPYANANGGTPTSFLSAATAAAPASAAFPAAGASASASTLLLPKVLVNTCPRSSTDGPAQRRSLGATSGNSSSSSSSAPTPSAQHRPACYPLLSRIVPTVAAVGLDTPLTSQTTATVLTVAPSFTSASAPTTEELSPLTGKGNNASSTETATSGGPLPSPRSSIGERERRSSLPSPSARLPPTAAGAAASRPLLAEGAAPPALRAPSLLMPIGALAPLPSSVPSPSAPTRPPPPQQQRQPFVNKSHRPATTCNVERRLSSQSNGAASTTSPANNTLNVLAMTARRVSASLPGSPTSVAPLAPQMLAPVALSPSPQPPANEKGVRLATPTAPATPPPAARQSDSAAARVETASTGSLHSQSGGEAESSEGRSDRGRCDTALPKALDPSPSSTQLMPPRRLSTPASPTPVEGAFTSSGRPVELTPNTRGGLESGGPPNGLELISMLQSSSTFATPFAFPESASVVDDPSLCCGASLHTQRFISASRILVPRTPLNLSMANGRGGSVDSVQGAPTRLVTAFPQNSGRVAAAAAASGSDTNGASSGVHAYPADRHASQTSLSMDDVIMAVLEGRADAGNVVSSAPQHRPSRATRPSAASASRGSSSGQGGATHSDRVDGLCSQSSAACANEDGSRPLSPDHPSAPRAASSVGSSFRRDDAVTQSSSSVTAVHAYPSIATFASDESRSSHSRDEAAARHRHSHKSEQPASEVQPQRRRRPSLEPHPEFSGEECDESDNRTTPAASAAAAAAAATRGQHAGPQPSSRPNPRSSDSHHMQLNSTTLRSNTMSASDESKDITTCETTEVWTKGHDALADVTASSLPSGEEGRAADLSLSPSRPPQAQPPQRRRGSTMKMLSRSAHHVAERVRKSTQWSRQRRSRPLQNGTATSSSPATPSVSVISGSQCGGGGGAAASELTSETISVAMPGASFVGTSTTFAFTDSPAQPQAITATDSNAQSMVSRHSSQKCSEAGQRADGSVGSSTHTVSALSSMTGEESTTSGSKTRRRSIASAVSKLWSKAASRRSRRSSVTSGQGSPLHPTLLESSTVHTTSEEEAAASGPTLLSSKPSSMVGEVDGSGSESSGGAASSLEESSCGSYATGTCGSPLKVEMTVTPRVVVAAARPAKKPRAGTDGANARVGVSGAAAAGTVSASGGAVASSPDAFLTSEEEIVFSPQRARRSPAVVPNRTPSLSTLGRPSLASRSSRSSVDTAGPDSEMLLHHSRPRTSNTTCGSADPLVSRDSTQAPVPWHAADPLPSNEDTPVLQFDNASPLAPSVIASGSSSRSSSSSSLSETSAAGRTTKSTRSEMSVTTVTKPIPGNRHHHRHKRVSTQEPQQHPSASNAAAVIGMWKGSSAPWSNGLLAGGSGGPAAAASMLPVPPHQQQTSSRSPRTGHGLYDALRAGSTTTTRTCELYAGQGQDAYDQLAAATSSGKGDSGRSPVLPSVAMMPAVASPFATAAAVRSRLGSARPGSARPGSARSNTSRPGSARGGGSRPGSARSTASRPGSARPGSTGLRRQRLIEIQDPAESPLLFRTTFHSSTGARDDASSPSTPLSETHLPPNTSPLPPAGQQTKSPGTRGINLGILATWVKSAKWAVPSSLASAAEAETATATLTSLRVPSTSAPLASISKFVSAVGGSGGDHAGTTAVVSFARPVFSSQRRRTFTSALHLSMPIDPPLTHVSSDGLYVSAGTTSSFTGTGAHGAPMSTTTKSPDSAAGGVSKRWSAAPTAAAIGFAPIDAQLGVAAPGNRSRWSLSSTSRRKWTSSTTSSHGSPSASINSQRNGGLLLRAPSGSGLASAAPPTTGGSPTSPQGSRRGFSGRKFATNASNANGSISGAAAASGWRSPRKHNAGAQTHALHTTSLPRATSAEGRRTGQVVLMDAPPPSEADQQWKHAPVPPANAPVVSRAASPVRPQRVSLLSAGGTAEAVPRYVVTPRHSLEGALQISQPARRKASEGWQSDTPLEQPPNTNGSTAQGPAESRCSTGSEETWLAAVTMSEGEPGLPHLSGWAASSAASPGFTPSTLSLVDLSTLMSGEGSLTPAVKSTGESTRAAPSVANAAASAPAPKPAAAAAAAPVSSGAAAGAFRTSSDSSQQTQHSLQHEDSSARSILSNNTNANHNAHGRALPKRSSGTAGAMVSPVSLSILMNSISFGSTNGAGGAAAAAAAAAAGNASPSPTLVAAPAGSAPAAVAATSLSATLGSGQGRSRSTRQQSPPPALLSCEAAPALFTMASGFGALHLQDSPSLALGRGAAPHFSLDYDSSGDDLMQTPSPLLQGGTYGGAGWLGDATAPSLQQLSSTAGGLGIGAAGLCSARVAPSPTGHAGERRSDVAAGNGAATTAATSNTSRRASRYARSPSYTGSNAPIPAPPSTNLTSQGSGVRSRRVASLLTAHGSSGVGTLGVPDAASNVSPARNGTLSNYSRHSSVVSELISEHNTSSVCGGSSGGGNCGGNTGGCSPLASSILYVPPELRRGPEWRHLQQYIAHNVAQSHQRETAGSSPLASHDSAGQQRGRTPITPDGAAGGDGPKGNYRRFTTTALSSGKEPSSLMPTAAQHQQQQQHARHSTTTPSFNVAPYDRSSMSLVSSEVEAPQGKREATRRPAAYPPLPALQSLASADTLGESFPLVPTSSTAQALPPGSLPPSFLAPVEILNTHRHSDGIEHVDEDRSSTRTPRGSKTAPQLSSLHSTMDCGEQQDLPRPLRPSSAVVPGGENELGVSQHRLSDDRRPPREQGSLDGDHHSSSRTSTETGQHRATPLPVVPKSQHHARILSGVPFVPSESDDDDVSHDGRSSSSAKTLSTGDPSRLVAPQPKSYLAAPTSSPSAAAAAPPDFSLSFSFPSARFASTSPGAGERQLAAMADLARFPVEAAAAEVVPAERGVAAKAVAVRRASRGSSLARAEDSGKDSFSSTRKSASVQERRGSSFHSLPECRYDKNGEAAETAVQKLNRVRNAVLALADARGSHSTGSVSGASRCEPRRSSERFNGTALEAAGEGGTPTGNPASTRYAFFGASLTTSYGGAEQQETTAGSNDADQPPLLRLHGPQRAVQSPLQSVTTAARRRQSAQSQLSVKADEAAPPAVATADASVAPPVDFLTPIAPQPTRQPTAGTRSSSVSEMFVFPAEQTQPPQQSPTSVGPTGGKMWPSRRASETPGAAGETRARRISGATRDHLQLLSFTPLVSGLTLMPDGAQRGAGSEGGTSRRESTAATAAPQTLITPKAADAARGGGVSSGTGGAERVRVPAGAEAPPGRSSLSYTGGAQRNSVVSFEAPLTMDVVPLPRYSASGTHATELSALKGILETPPTTTSTSGSNGVRTPSSASQRVVEVGPGSGVTEPVTKPSSSSSSSLLRGKTVASRRRSSAGQSEAASAGTPTRLSASPAKAKNRPHHIVPNAATPFLLPNCTMMSSVDLGSPSESTIVGNATSPHTTFYPTSVSNAVSVSGPLAMSGGASAAMGDSILTSATEEHRTLMMLSAFPARQTPVAAPSLLSPAETVDHYFPHGNNGVHAAAGAPTTAAIFSADSAGVCAPPRQLAVSPSARRGVNNAAAANAGRGRPATEPAMPPRPPSGGRVPSASTGSSAVNNTMSSSSTSSQKLLSHTGTTTTTTATTATTTSTSSHLGAAPRWHAFSTLSSPPRPTALVMRVANTSVGDSPTARATPPLLPRPPSKVRLTATQSTASPAATSAARHTAGS